MPNPDDQACHDIAKQMEQDNPRWIVLFGVFSKEFVGFPRFSAPPGTVVTAQYAGDGNVFAPSDKER